MGKLSCLENRSLKGLEGSNPSPSAFIPYPPDVIPSGCPEDDESDEDEDDE